MSTRQKNAITAGIVILLCFAVFKCVRLLTEELRPPNPSYLPDSYRRPQ